MNQDKITRVDRRGRLILWLIILILSVNLSTIYMENSTMAAKISKKSIRRSAPPADETPAEAFSRLATGRTYKAVKSIGLIAQLTGSAYESTDVQKRAIVTALEASVEQVKEVFAGTAKSSDSFKLPN